ncbi:helix-turn-helix transcriptional regulator [Cohnella abietis]|uniref:HTH cro/C1-type domain-containing protein n=1 Tax=Cohnella abietis TaxID=2507935 RepID=A0A3T1D1W4_9BACL|nr:helix-turn-helix transcriptional regulator [Cohnella abietis]BBI32009.1 hypothetical protein KCTCHS21_14080 [Cohnella abietis]
MEREWLERLRKEKKMTHEQVANRAKITRQYYGMIASGERDPRVEVAKKIGNTLDFNWTLFFDKEGNKTIPYN